MPMEKRLAALGLRLAFNLLMAHGCSVPPASILHDDYPSNNAALPVPGLPEVAAHFAVREGASSDAKLQAVDLARIGLVNGTSCPPPRCHGFCRFDRLRCDASHLALHHRSALDNAVADLGPALLTELADPRALFASRCAEVPVAVAPDAQPSPEEESRSSIEELFWRDAAAARSASGASAGVVIEVVGRRSPAAEQGLDVVDEMFHRHEVEMHNVTLGLRGRGQDADAAAPAAATTHEQAVELSELLTRLLPSAGSPSLLMLDLLGAEFELLPWLLSRGLLCRVKYMAIDWHLNQLPVEKRLSGLGLRLSLDNLLSLGCREPPVVVFHGEQPSHNMGAPVPGLAEAAMEHAVWDRPANHWMASLQAKDSAQLHHMRGGGDSSGMSCAMPPECLGACRFQRLSCNATATALHYASTRAHPITYSPHVFQDLADVHKLYKKWCAKGRNTSHNHDHGTLE